MFICYFTRVLIDFEDLDNKNIRMLKLASSEVGE